MLGSQAFRRLVATRLSSDFANCTAVETGRVGDLLAAMTRPTSVVVKNHFVGINASDINYTAGAYRPNVKPPFAVGMEAIGEVVAAPAGSPFAVGAHVISSDFGAFAEFQLVDARYLRRVPRIDPRLPALEISGATASIALAEVAHPARGETALVTAAAGGTGIFAVQLLAKKYGCHVIGTCSSDEKARVLTRLGCAEVVNYATADVAAFFKARGSSGALNVVYESVGGSMLDVAIENICVRGRIVTIGGIEAYASQGDWARHTRNATRLPQLLLGKSASLRGFFLPHFKKLHQRHFDELVQLVDDGTIESCVDTTCEFAGVEQIADAVAHLHAKKNIGKVVVRLV